MKRWIKITIGVIAVLCLMAGAFYVGGLVGFASGTGYNAAITAPMDGVVTVAILRAIREGRTDSAVKLLEINLDTKVIEHSLLVKGTYSPFDLFRMNQHSGKFMVVIAKYRQEYPTESPVGSVIEEILNEYLTSAQE